MDLFYAGGPLFMSLLSLILLAMLAATYRFPHLLKHLGKLALAIGCLGFMIGFFEMLQAVEKTTGVAQNMLAGGLKNSMISPIYGLLIYIFGLFIQLFLNEK